MVAKFLFVSKCPGIGATLYRNGIISILFSTIQTFDQFFWKSNCPGFMSHCTRLDRTLPRTCYSSSSGNDSRFFLTCRDSYMLVSEGCPPRKGNITLYKIQLSTLGVKKDKLDLSSFNVELQFCSFVRFHLETGEHTRTCECKCN